MRFRRVFLIAALLASTGPLGCSKKDGGKIPRSKNKNTYVHATISDIDSLDPAWAYDTASHCIYSNIYETLLAYRGSSTTDLDPLIAEQVPSRENGLISEDGKTYTFPIRKEVRFHGGETLTPEDVRYSLMRFMLFDRAGGPSSLLLEPVTGLTGTRDRKGTLVEGIYEKVAKAVRVEGDSVVLTLDAPFAPILSVLASWAPILPKDWCAANGEWDGTEASWKEHNNPDKTASYLHDRSNGTGPFQLERWDKQNREVVLVRFDGYWREKAKLERAVIRGINEFQTRKLMLSAGDADSIYADYMQQPLLRNMEGVEIIDDLPRLDMNPTIFFVLRVATDGNPYIGSGKLDGKGIPPDFFADKDIRKAFAHSLDYEGYIRDVNRSKGTRARSFIPKGLFGHNPQQAVHEYDLEKAEAYFKKARGGKVWKRGFKFTFAYNAGNTGREVVANMIKRAVESINPAFVIETRPVQWSTYLHLSDSSKLPMFIMGWNPDFPDPHNFAFPFMHSRGNYPSLQHYRNPEADRLVEQAKSTSDPAKRRELYYRLQEIAYEDVPTLFVLNTVRYRVQRSWVQGYTYNPIQPGSPYLCPLYSLSKR